MAIVRVHIHGHYVDSGNTVRWMDRYEQVDEGILGYIQNPTNPKHRDFCRQWCFDANPNDTLSGVKVERC